MNRTTTMLDEKDMRTSQMSISYCEGLERLLRATVRQLTSLL